MYIIVSLVCSRSYNTYSSLSFQPKLPGRMRRRLDNVDLEAAVFLPPASVALLAVLLRPLSGLLPLFHLRVVAVLLSELRLHCSVLQWR